MAFGSRDYGGPELRGRFTTAPLRSSVDIGNERVYWIATKSTKRLPGKVALPGEYKAPYPGGRVVPPSFSFLSAET